ncbi:hypothetical protein ACFLX5_05530 [Chloroflexota bacterium]
MIGQAELDMLNELTGFSTLDLQSAGGRAIPKMGVGFLLSGFP